MTHRSFPRGFKVGRSANVAMLNSGTGGMLGKNQRMPMPQPAPQSGAGGFGRGLPGNRPQAQPNQGPRRGTGQGTEVASCGCYQAMVMAGEHQPTCGNAPIGEPSSLTTTLSAVPGLGTATLTAQVTAGSAFNPFGVWMAESQSTRFIVLAVRDPQGNNLLMNNQAILGELMSNRDTPYPINGCSVQSALSLSVDVQNIGTTTAFAQVNFVGVYPR
jgi:hypothetical protein